MKRHNAPNDLKAHADAIVWLRSCLFRRGQKACIVANRQAFARPDRYFDRDALRCVFDGVFNQIADRVLDQGSISDHRYRPMFDEGDRGLSIVHPWSDIGDRLSAEGCQIQR